MWLHVFADTQYYQPSYLMQVIFICSILIRTVNLYNVGSISFNILAVRPYVGNEFMAQALNTILQTQITITRVRQALIHSVRFRHKHARARTFDELNLLNTKMPGRRNSVNTARLNHDKQPTIHQRNDVITL